MPRAAQKGGNCGNLPRAPGFGVGGAKKLYKSIKLPCFTDFVGGGAPNKLDCIIKLVARLFQREQGRGAGVYSYIRVLPD